MLAMNVRAVVSAVESELRAAGTEERRSVASWYFPTSMHVHGVTVPDLRRVARELSREHRAEPGDAIVALADALVEAGSTPKQA